MRLRDLSLRHKIPLQSAVVILATALMVTASLVYRASVDLEHDLKASAERLARVLARTLTPLVIHDDVWRAFEIVRTPLQALDASDAARVEAIVVLDEKDRVYVSSHPERYPILSDPARANPELAALAGPLAVLSGENTVTVEPAGGPNIYVLAPVMADGVRVATLVMTYSKSIFAQRFGGIVKNAFFITLLVVAAILPIAWYWGHRMAIPLVRLAECMRLVGTRKPEEIECSLRESRDEIGQLGAAFQRMLAELREKETMEKQVMVSERLAALGRLSAGIAHEINNPLGGMLNAISTYRRHGGEALPPLAQGPGEPCSECALPGNLALSQRTLSLLERGLLQIKETVGALLVEAKVESHPLTPQDLEDIRTLVLSDAHPKGAHLAWDNRIEAPLPLPSTLVRQILLNLLLNATRAVEAGGRIECGIQVVGERLEIRVSNDGAYIPEHEQQYLFEPFFRLSEDGNGLGLWVTYQIVQQLGGSIRVRSEPGETRFVVHLPVSPEHEARAPAGAMPG
ncbi:MAG: HAMP domain-containing sensor histidine kinase [Pseudomonadota bacterium]